MKKFKILSVRYMNITNIEINEKNTLTGIINVHDNIFVVTQNASNQ